MPPRCGHESDAPLPPLRSPDTQHCRLLPRLRGEDNPQSKSIGLKLVLGALAVFAGLLWVVAISSQSQHSTTPTPAPQAQSLASTSLPPAAPVAQTLDLTSAQHLSEAKRALADGYKPNKDPQKTSWGRRRRALAPEVNRAGHTGVPRSPRVAEGSRQAREAGTRGEGSGASPSDSRAGGSGRRSRRRLFRRDDGPGDD
jgi:hypothetical protein